MSLPLPVVPGSAPSSPPAYPPVGSPVTPAMLPTAAAAAAAAAGVDFLCADPTASCASISLSSLYGGTPAAKGEDAAAATGGGVGDGGGCGAEAGGRTKAAAALPPSSASVEVAADGWMLPFDDVATAVPDTVLEGMQAAAAAAVSSMEGPGGGVDDVALPSMFDEDIDHLYRVPEVDMMFSGMGAGHPKSELVDVALMAEGL